MAEIADIGGPLYFKQLKTVANDVTNVHVGNSSLPHGTLVYEVLDSNTSRSISENARRPLAYPGLSGASHIVAYDPRTTYPRWFGYHRVPSRTVVCDTRARPLYTPDPPLII